MSSTSCSSPSPWSTSSVTPSSGCTCRPPLAALGRCFSRRGASAFSSRLRSMVPSLYTLGKLMNNNTLERWWPSSDFDDEEAPFGIPKVDRNARDLNKKKAYYVASLIMCASSTAMAKACPAGSRFQTSDILSHSRCIYGAFEAICRTRTLSKLLAHPCAF